MESPVSPKDLVHSAQSSADADASPLQSRAVRIGLAIGFLAVLAALGLAFLDWRLSGRFRQSTNDAYVQADAVAVAPKISGYAAKVLVAENQTVAQGQPLVQIDPGDLQTRRRQAAAQAEASDWGLKSLDAEEAADRAALDQANAQLGAATAARGLAEREVERLAPLVASGGDTRQHLDQVKTSLVQSAAQERAAAAGLAAARSRLDGFAAHKAQVAAQATGASAAQDAADRDLAATLITAPMAGRVGDLSVRAGQFVQPGLRLMTVTPVQSAYVVANFKETQIGMMRPGAPVTVRLDALPDQKLHGVVESLSPGTGAQFALIPPSNATGNFTKIVQRVPVRIRLDLAPDLAGRMIAGLSATVEVDTRPGAGHGE